jgi:hypothetical protein
LEAGFDLAAQFFSALQSRHAIGLAILSDRRLAIEVRQPALLAA